MFVRHAPETGELATAVDLIYISHGGHAPSRVSRKGVSALLSVASVCAAGLLASAATAAPSDALTSYPPSYFTSSSPTTALDMVSLLPGFTFDKGSSVRGFGGAAGNVLIDGGRPASKDDGLDDTLKRIPATSVLRIDVIRGGAPGIDMQGKTVIANVVRRTDRGGKLLLAFSNSVDYNGRRAPAARAEGSTRLGAVTLEGSLQLSRGFDDGAGDGPRTRRAANGQIIIQGSEFSKGSGTIDKLTGALEAPVFGGKLRVHASLASTPYQLTTDDHFLTPPGGEFERYHQTQQTAEMGVRFERQLGPKLISETFLLQQIGRASERDAFNADRSVALVTGDDVADVFSVNKTTAESIVRSKLRYQLAPTLTLEAGGEADYNTLTTETGFLQDGIEVLLPAANVHVAETRGEGFATAVWTVHPRLLLETGLRVEASTIASTGDVVSSQTFMYAKPRAVLTWSPDSRDQLRFRIEREVGQLNFDDFAANSGNLSTGDVRAGNPRLNPQTDWVYEAAYERRFWRGGDATVTLRHFAISDVIDRVPVLSPDGEFDAPGNIGPGRKDELVFALTLPTDRLGLKRGLLTGTATFRQSQVIDPTTKEPRPISQLHPNYWEVHFTDGLPKLKSTWGFDLTGQFVETSYRYNEIDVDKRKIFVLLFAEYKPKPDLIFRTELRNLGSAAFEHARVVYSGPRSLGALDSIDVRDLHNGPAVYFRVIKTFG